MGILEFLENNAFAILLRESPSVLGYPTILAFHTLGMAMLVGPSVGIALRMLGVAPGVPLAPLEKFFPVVWLGSVISLVSGLILLMLKVKVFLATPAFYIKLLAIVVAVMVTRSLRTRVFGDRAGISTGPVPREGQILAGAMLISWWVAVTAGRMTAYDSSIGSQTAVAVFILTVVLLVGGYVAVRVWGAKPSAQ